MHVPPPTGRVAPLSPPGPAEPAAPVGSGFREHLSQALAGAPAPASATPSAPSRLGQAAQAFVERAFESQHRLDEVIAQARSGRTFSVQEILALQATVYRHTTTLEVFGKAVEQVGSAVKQTLGTQV